MALRAWRSVCSAGGGSSRLAGCSCASCSGLQRSLLVGFRARLRRSGLPLLLLLCCSLPPLRSYVLTGMLGISMSYHRQLSHKSFRTPKVRRGGGASAAAAPAARTVAPRRWRHASSSRRHLAPAALPASRAVGATSLPALWLPLSRAQWLEFALAYCGALAFEGDPIEWSKNHRWHHKHSDSPADRCGGRICAARIHRSALRWKCNECMPSAAAGCRHPRHSPRDGIWHAHMGWLFDESLTNTRCAGPLRRLAVCCAAACSRGCKRQLVAPATHAARARTHTNHAGATRPATARTAWQRHGFTWSRRASTAGCGKPTCEAARCVWLLLLLAQHSTSTSTAARAAAAMHPLLLPPTTTRWHMLGQAAFFAAWGGLPYFIWLVVTRQQCGCSV